MTMFKFFARQLMIYIAVIVGLTLLGIVLFVGYLVFFEYEQSQSETYPDTVFNELINNDKEFVLNDQNKALLESEQIWMMELDDQGEIRQSYLLPQNLNRSYSNRDIVRFTRWYLEDYPVFTYPSEKSILVLGYPKRSYDKLPDNFYKFDLMRRIFIMALILFLGMLAMIFIIYFRGRFRLNEELKPINEAVHSLKNNRFVKLDVQGNFSEIKETLNQASETMQENQKNRDHWIRGVSHDLRNPLTLIMANVHRLEHLEGPKKELSLIQSQVQRMQEIISNLNLIYLLDNPHGLKKLDNILVDPFLRKCLSEFINTYPEVEMEINLEETKATILGIPSLLERAINNLLLNSIQHNQEVQLKISITANEEGVTLEVSDNGTIELGMIEELNTKESNYAAHGMGVIISKQIIKLHGGKLHFSFGDPGLIASIQLPLENVEVEVF